MKRLIQGFALACLVLVLAAGSTQAGEGTWVSKSGNVHAIHGGNAVFVSADDAERFDLSDLSDGETRTFGTGARAVTVSRSGDAVTISRSRSGDDVSGIDITCQLDDDTCTVLTFPNDPEKVMVAIEKERTCVNAVGDCDFSFGEGHGGGHVVVDIDCDGDDCEEFHTMHMEGLSELHNAFTIETTGDGGEASRIVIRRIGDPGAKEDNVFVTSMGASVGGLHGIRVLHGDNVMLRCSEGDATIMVEKEEAEDTFLCPKHSTPMEQVKGHGSGVRVIRTGGPGEH
jgi:hypothetical protein